jgi:hypothetical protein
LPRLTAGFYFCAIGDASIGTFDLALGPSAPQRCSKQLLTWVARISEEFDLQAFTHVYETRSQAVLARVSYQADNSSLVSLLARLGLLNKRLTISHGVWIDVVRRRTVQTGVHESDVDGAGDGRPVLGEKAFRGLRPGEAESMDRDGSLSAIPRDLDGVGPAAEQMDVFRKDEFLRYLGQSVVVAPDDEDLDACRI